MRNIVFIKGKSSNKKLEARMVNLSWMKIFYAKSRITDL